MKKNILKDIEELKEKRKLSKEARDKIISRTIANWAICIAIAILIMTFEMASKMLAKPAAIFVYNVYAIVFLLCSIVILEIAYKKDSGIWAISGLEILALSVFTLFAPSIFFRLPNIYIYIALIVITIYYIAKIAQIVYKERKEYLLEISDISNIIKKESKDEQALDFKEERKEQLIKETKKKVTTKKRQTQKSSKTPTKKTQTQKTSKTPTKKTQTQKTSKTPTKKTQAKTKTATNRTKASGTKKRTKTSVKPKTSRGATKKKTENTNQKENS